MNTDYERIDQLKHFFINELNKGRILSWGDFHEKIVQKEIDHFLISPLKLWFTNITEFKLLDGVHSNTEELFVHNADHCYIKDSVQTIFYEHDFTQEDIELMLNYLAVKNEQKWNYVSPYVSFNLKKQNMSLRVTLIHHSLNPEGQSKAFFRVLNKTPISLQEYGNTDFLQQMILNKKNILIAGSTGSGKSTLMNSLLSQTSPQEHIVILEDTYELHSPTPRTTRLLSADSSLDKLLSYSLRMSPDRIILGEIRSQEVLTYVLGMNTGHKGMISSIHANNAKESLLRLATLYGTYAPGKMNFEMILKLVCSNIDYVIYIEEKVIVEIIEVFGSEKNHIFYDNAI